jgi:hypothetical protein
MRHAGQQRGDATVQAAFQLLGGGIEGAAGRRPAGRHCLGAGEVEAPLRSALVNSPARRRGRDQQQGKQAVDQKGMPWQAISTRSSPV